MYFSYDLFRSYKIRDMNENYTICMQNTKHTLVSKTHISNFILFFFSPLLWFRVFTYFDFLRLSFLVIVDFDKSSPIFSMAVSFCRLDFHRKLKKNSEHKEYGMRGLWIQGHKHKTISDDFILIFVTAYLCSFLTHIHIIQMEKHGKFAFFCFRQRLKICIVFDLNNLSEMVKILGKNENRLFWFYFIFHFDNDRLDIGQFEYMYKIRKCWTIAWVNRRSNVMLPCQRCNFLIT